MKKEFLGLNIILFLTILILPQILALDEPTTGIGGSDVEQIENLTEDIPINPETGDVDWGKLENLKSKAEVRIDKINLWIEENTPWLGPVFGMIPEISWTFAINIYFILFFIVLLILNAKALFPFISSLGKARLLGSAVFIVLLVLKFYVMLVRIMTNVFGIIFQKLLPWGIGITLIIMVLLIFILAFTGINLFPIIIKIVSKTSGSKEKKEGQELQEHLDVIKAESQAIKDKYSE